MNVNAVLSIDSFSKASASNQRSQRPPRFIPLERVPELVSSLRRPLVKPFPRRMTYDWAKHRDCLALLLGLQGLCVGEVHCLDCSDFDALAGEISVPVIKRRNARRIPLPKGLVKFLTIWIDRLDGSALFPSIRSSRTSTRIFQYACRKQTSIALGVKFNFHCLRHTFAMALYDRTRDVFLVKRALGHKSLASTLIYADTLADLSRVTLWDV